MFFAVKSTQRKSKEPKAKGTPNGPPGPDSGSTDKKAEIATQSSPAVSAAPVGQVSTEQLSYPPPEIVAAAAREETSPRLVADYYEAIVTLRDEKRFTFREIAEWLAKKFGIEADHNAVYRAYVKGMDDYGAALAAQADDEDEREDAMGA